MTKQKSKRYARKRSLRNKWGKLMKFTHDSIRAARRGWGLGIC